MSQDDVIAPETGPAEPAPVEPSPAEPETVETDPEDSDPAVPDADIPEAGDVTAAAAAPIECPPATEQPERHAQPDPRAQLNQLAAQLVRSRSRRLLIEFLQLRRALRV